MPATPRDFGAKGDGLTDDSAALIAWAAAGGGELPLLDRYILNATPTGAMRGGANFTLTGGGKILYRRGWASGYFLSSKDWGTLTGGWRINGSAGAEMVFDGPTDPSTPRKGLGLTCLSDFVVDRFGVSGAAMPGKNMSLFANEARSCRGGLIIGGRRGGDVRNLSGQIGSDAWHLSGGNQDIEARLLDLLASDDAWGDTEEIAKFAGAAGARIRLRNCILRAKGFSGFKALLTAAAGAATKTDLEVLYCRIELELGALGAGVAVIGVNENRALGGRIDGLLIRGGETNVTVPKGGLVGGTLMQFKGVDRLVVENHRVRHWHRTVFDLDDCPGARIANCDVVSVARVPAPSKGANGVARLRNSPGASVSTAKFQPGYVGQALLSIE